MEDYLLVLAADTALIAMGIGGLAFVLKKWITSAVDAHFSKSLEVIKSGLQLQLRQEQRLNDTRMDIYPEIVELIYRLRNNYRGLLEKLDTLKSGDTKEMPVMDLPQIGEELYKLTENLYKYRVYVEEDVFIMLHRFKRLMQNAQNSINRIEYPPDEEFDEWLEQKGRVRVKVDTKSYFENEEYLNVIYKEINALYPMITKEIKKEIVGRKDQNIPNM